MFYFVKTPYWVKKLFSKRIWEMPGSQKTIYLSFDDGPDPVITPFVLDELDKFNAKATFFCIGKHVDAHPEVYHRIQEAGHAVGNHTYDHPDAWKTKNNDYLDNVLKAKASIDSSLFRPPYGHITRRLSNALLLPPYRLHTVMWSVLSGDFDERLSPEKCYHNIISHMKNGSIVVFHDSKKAATRMRYCLPLVLKHFSELGFSFEKITVK